jgi:hypothetical protein
VQGFGSAELNDAFERSVALSPEDILARIQTSIDSERLTPFAASGYSGSKPMIGRVSGRTFSLQRRRVGKNGFAPRLVGRVEPDGNGALVRARIALDGPTKWLFAIYLVVTFLLPLAIAATDRSPDSLSLLAAGAALALIGLVVAAIGVASGAHERAELIAFLNDLLSR